MMSSETSGYNQHSSGGVSHASREILDLFTLLPPDYDEDLYREYQDLRPFTSQQLLQHWLSHGLEEGRRASAIRDRSSLLALLAQLPIQSALEIGCFDQPSLGHLSQEGIVTHYADYLSEADLKLRAEQLPGRNPSQVPPIEYVLSDGYEKIKRNYDIVVSHHCIEHQPDLLSHLLAVSRILEPKGLYIASIPDKRNCFDHFLPASSIIDVLTAFYEKRTKPSFRSVLEHRCFIVEDYSATLDPIWNSGHGRASREGFDAAAQEFANSAYVDVHTFQFTSFTFKNIINQLSHYAFLPAEARINVYNGVNEFYIALQF
jgi:SAM-dependent methyltransferase